MPLSPQQGTDCILCGSGFEIEQLIEPQPPEGATATVETVPLEWARKWPSEEIWVARRT